MNYSSFMVYELWYIYLWYMNYSSFKATKKQVYKKKLAFWGSYFISQALS